MGLMEQLLRVTDQLDEQLHAGYYFYLLTSKTTLISNSGFVYPLVVIILGFLIPNFIKYYEFKRENGDADPNGWWPQIFIVLAYVLGFIFMIIPNLYLEYVLGGGQNKGIRSEFCLGENSLKARVTSVTLLLILTFSIALLSIFKMVQPKSQNLWFSIKSHYWWPNLVFAGSLVVYQFSQSLIICLFIFPMIQSAAYLGRGLFSAVQTTFLVSATLGATIFLLFGTFLANPSLLGISPLASLG